MIVHSKRMFIDVQKLSHRLTMIVGNDTPTASGSQWRKLHHLRCRCLPVHTGLTSGCAPCDPQFWLQTSLQEKTQWGTSEKLWTESDLFLDIFSPSEDCWQCTFIKCTREKPSYSIMILLNLFSLTPNQKCVYFAHSCLPNGVSEGHSSPINIDFWRVNV